MTHTQLKKLTLTTLSSLLIGSLAACAGRQAAPVPMPSTAAPSATAPPGEPPALDRIAVRDSLAKTRRAQIDRLRLYSDAGLFPINREQPGMLNLFIDDAGSICAAANLMWQDGHETLVRKTAATDNTLRLAAVTSGPLMDWMLTSGLTQGEIERIQEPYGFIDEPDPALIATEVERLQAHFALVLAELEADWDASLDAATQRLASHPGLVASL